MCSFNCPYMMLLQKTLVLMDHRFVIEGYEDRNGIGEEVSILASSPASHVSGQLEINHGKRKGI